MTSAITKTDRSFFAQKPLGAEGSPAATVSLTTNGPFSLPGSAIFSPGLHQAPTRTEPFVPPLKYQDFYNGLSSEGQEQFRNLCEAIAKFKAVPDDKAKTTKTGQRIFSSLERIEADKLKAGKDSLNLTEFFKSENVPLEYADLSDANFSNANFSDVKLNGATVRNAKFNNANMWSASFRNATLQDAQLKGAVLRQVNFTGTNLTDADLSGAELNMAQFDNKTRLGGETRFNNIKAQTIIINGTSYNVQEKESEIRSWLEGRSVKRANISFAKAA